VISDLRAISKSPFVSLDLCLVVGGGDAAIEASIALGAAGATVHLAHRGKLFDRIKSFISCGPPSPPSSPLLLPPFASADLISEGTIGDLPIAVLWFVPPTQTDRDHATALARWSLPSSGPWRRYGSVAGAPCVFRCRCSLR
jgi:hypothetical protein